MAEEQGKEAMRIGDLIRELRESRGWSQEEMAPMVHVTVGTLSRWERGKHQGYAKNVRQLAEVLGVAPSLLHPAPPEVESQLDRIEGKLDALTELLTRVPLTAEWDQIAREIEDEEPPGDQRGEEPRPGE